MAFQFRQETRAVIRRRVGYLMYGRDKFVVTTASAGAAATVTADIFRRWPDDYFTGATVFIASGTGSGQQREVSDHVQSTGVLTVSANWSTNPDNTSVIEIWPAGADPNLINENINLAILRAQDIVQVPVTTNPSAISSNLDQLSLTATVVKVSRMYYFENSILYEYYPNSWMDTTGYRSFVQRGGILYVTPPISSSILSSQVQIEGYRLPALLTTDSDLAEVRSDYLTNMAAFYTDAGQAEGAVLDPEQHSARASQWLKEALAIEGRMVTNWKANTQEV